MRSPAPALLVPSVNCWRIETAHRFACLIDNAAYFEATRQALVQAQRSIMLLGWEFDGHTALTHEDCPDAQIGALLARLAAERPQLEIRILVWAVSPAIALALHGMPWLARLRFRGSRVRFVLDDNTPRGACHHQKLVVVDEATAFCSGADFMPNRWDRPQHADRDRGRLLRGGRMSPPRHAATALADGPLAAALAELARARWQQATGEALPPLAGQGADAWPRHIEPEMREVRAGIARTAPAWKQHAAVRENEALYLDAIAAARRTLYLENQYFASERIALALAERLSGPTPPEIVVVCSATAPNLFDRLTMDPARDRLIARLRAADRQGRLAVYAPYSAGGSEIVVHSKVMIVDRSVLRIGSSNLNNRSMGFDSECDIAVDDPRQAEAIERFRNALVGHFLGRTAEEVQSTMRAHASLARAIELLDRNPRRLRPLHGGVHGPLRRLIASYHLGDPCTARDSWRPWRRGSCEDRARDPL